MSRNKTAQLYCFLSFHRAGNFFKFLQPTKPDTISRSRDELISLLLNEKGRSDGRVKDLVAELSGSSLPFKLSALDGKWQARREADAGEVAISGLLPLLFPSSKWESH